jgi:hypothetical protein
VKLRENHLGADGLALGTIVDDFRGIPDLVTFQTALVARFALLYRCLRVVNRDGLYTYRAKQINSRDAVVR